MLCPNKKITIEAVARRYRVHPNTLRRWNADRKLGFPRPIRLRGILFYELADLIAWEEQFDEKFVAKAA